MKWTKEDSDDLDQTIVRMRVQREEAWLLSGGFVDSQAARRQAIAKVRSEGVPAALIARSLGLHRSRVYSAVAGSRIIDVDAPVSA